MSIQIETVLSIPFEENAYLVYREGATECVMIDPGIERNKTLAAIQKRGMTLVAILCTHGHADHIGSVPDLKAAFPQAQLIIGSGDAGKLTDAKKNLSADFGMPIVAQAADVVLTEERQTLNLAGIEFEALRTPGHSAGHYVFLLRERTPNVVFVGDLVFYNSVGRSDFYDGDFQELEKSIREKIYTLDDATVLYCGHGPSTLVGTERKTNPFVQG